MGPIEGVLLIVLLAVIAVLLFVRLTRRHT